MPTFPTPSMPFRWNARATSVTTHQDQDRLTLLKVKIPHPRVEETILRWPRKTVERMSGVAIFRLQFDSSQPDQFVHESLHLGQFDSFPPDRCDQLVHESSHRGHFAGRTAVLVLVLVLARPVPHVRSGASTICWRVPFASTEWSDPWHESGGMAWTASWRASACGDESAGCFSRSCGGIFYQSLRAEKWC